LETVNRKRAKWGYKAKKEKISEQCKLLEIQQIVG
jgi:hypothetical protein